MEAISLFIGCQKLLASSKSLMPGQALGDGILFYGDTLSLRVYILNPNADTGGNHPTPWDVVNNNDLSLKVAIGDVGSGDSMTPLCYQNTWAKDADNQYFYADLSLATAELKAALGSLTSLSKIFEVKQDKGGSLTTIYQQLVTIKPRAIGPTTVVPLPPDTPISKEEVSGTYQPRIGEAGAVQRLLSPNGLYAVDLYVDNNGVFHTEQVTI